MRCDDDTVFFVRDQYDGFSDKHAALRSKNKDLFARNQDNVSELNDMSTRGLLCQ
jgi:hypothetical protein